jgi:hypothetical protein
MTSVPNIFPAWRIPVSINALKNQVSLSGCRFDTLFEVVQMKSDFETATLQPMRHDPGAGEYRGGKSQVGGTADRD